MRALMAAAAAATLILSIQPSRPAQAGDNPILRKDNDAGASSTVVKKNEPPVPAMPAPRETDKPVGSPAPKSAQ